MTTSPSHPLAASLGPLIEGQLSLPARLGHVTLFLAALIMTAVVGSLWATEPALPARTQAAFAAMTAIGLSWAGYALWTLTYRRVMLARQRVVAGWMSVAFTGVFLAGAIAAMAITGSAAAAAAAATGFVMLAAAAVMLARARRTLGQLLARRDELARQMEGTRP